jgi:hypothetical protein
MSRCLIHRRRDSCEIPRSAATSRIYSLELRYRRTASALNSGGYELPLPGIMAPFLGAHGASFRVSVKPGQLHQPILSTLL